MDDSYYTLKYKWYKVTFSIHSLVGSKQFRSSDEISIACSSRLDFKLQ